MYIFRRAAARAVSAPRQIRASPRVTSFQSSIPSLARSFHQSRIWRAEEQRSEEPETTSSTAQDAVSESSGTTSEPLGQSEHQSQTVSEPESSETSSESKPVLEQASELAESAKETVSDAAAKAAQAVGEFTQQPQEKAQDAAANVSEQAQDAAANVSEQAQEAASKVSEHAQSAASTTARAARDTAASTRDTFLPQRNRSGDDIAEPTKILYVGNLFFEVTAPQLEAEFAQFGEVANSRVITDDRGMSKGFAYLEFANLEQSTAARNALDQKVFQGRRLSVQFHKRRVAGAARDSARGPAKPSKTLFIGNMSYQMSDKDLNDLFRQIRNVLDVRVAIDRRSGQPRGFAHADFVDVESAVLAKETLENKMVYGRQLRIDFSGQSKEGGAADRGGERFDRGGHRGDRGDRHERRDNYERRERPERSDRRDPDSF